MVSQGKQVYLPATLVSAVSLMEAERSINLFKVIELGLQTMASIYVGFGLSFSDLALVAAVNHCQVDEE